MREVGERVPPERHDERRLDERELGLQPRDVVRDLAGARATPGSGLAGLADRVGALDGVLEVESPPGEGTVLRATLPL